MGKRTNVPHGSVFSIVCEVKNRAGSYCDIPWFQGNRVDTVRSPGGDTSVAVNGSNGEKYEFPDAAAYMEFWTENTSEEDL